MQMASAEEEVLTPLQFREGANAYEVEAISSGLSDLIKGTFEHWFSESHFIYPPNCSTDVNDCRKNLDFEIDFETASVDLNNDGNLEVIVYYNAPASCGSGGCASYILVEDTNGFRVMGIIFPSNNMYVSSILSGGYRNLHYSREEANYSCVFGESEKKYFCTKGP